ncbi:MAG: C39 family peptidase [Chitinispirillaceae bacterium]|nr:C39 family peptidase [Chitinispirillaceae bacterium]
MHRCISWNAIFFLLITRPVISAGQVLEVPEVIQEQTEWCWAAVSCCVLSYYGTPVSQCTIADYTRTHATWHDFGSISCCEDPKKKCNYWNYNYGYTGSIEDILEEWGVESRGTGRSLTPEKIQGELGAGRPFVIRWALKTSGGHFLVGHGIADSTIYYMDPWRGEGYKIADYAWVLSNNSHTWQGTNVMTADPALPGPVTLLSPSDTSLNQSRAPVFLWRKVGAASYRFQCATTESFSAPVKDTAVAGDTTLHLTGLSPSTVYFWRVCATNAAGAGAWSAIRRFTTEPSTAAVAEAGRPPVFVSVRLKKNALSITYTVPFASEVDIGIHTLRGELLRRVCNGFHHPGRYSKRCAGVNLSSGNYLLSLRAGNYRKTALMVHDNGM